MATSAINPMISDGSIRIHRCCRQLRALWDSVLTPQSIVVGRNPDRYSVTITQNGTQVFTTYSGRERLFSNNPTQ